MFRSDVFYRMKGFCDEQPRQDLGRGMTWNTAAKIQTLSDYADLAKVFLAKVRFHLSLSDLHCNGVISSESSYKSLELASMQIETICVFQGASLNMCGK